MWRAVDRVRVWLGAWAFTAAICVLVPLVVIAAWAVVGLALGYLIHQFGAVAGCALAFALYGAARLVDELLREWLSRRRV